MRSSESGTETQSIEELEMLLEAYFVVIDSTLNKLTSVSTTVLLCILSSCIPFLNPAYFFLIQLKEYIDDTEDFINIQLVCIIHSSWFQIDFTLH